MLIRPADARDVTRIQEIYAPVVRETVISFEVEPPTEAEIADRIAHTLPAFPWLVAVVDDRVAGYAYAHPFAERAAYAWSVETSIYLDSDARGRGVGRRLYGVLLAVVRVQGYRQAFAGVTLPNPASVGLHEAMGFRPAATYRRVGWKHGEWHDVGWWQLALVPDDSPPTAPISFDRLEPDLVGRLLRIGSAG